jgi:cytochrome b561
LHAGAEVLSFAAVIGGDAVAMQIVKQCCRNLLFAVNNAEKHVAEARCWALTLGATHRSVGGVVLHSALAEIVTVLISYAKSAAACRIECGIAAHALHGLYLVMLSAFGASGWVEVVLDMALTCLLMPGVPEVGFQPAAAAIVTAIVEVQGPEFCPTSKTHPVAKCVSFLLSADPKTVPT